ncbi:orexin receptor type 1, partial [Plakobranchus ocellatus]
MATGARGDNSPWIFYQDRAGAADDSDRYLWPHNPAGQESGGGGFSQDYQDLTSPLRVIRSAVVNTLNNTIGSIADVSKNANNYIYPENSSSKSDMTYGESTIGVGGLFVMTSDHNLVSNDSDSNGSAFNRSQVMDEAITMPEYILVWVIAANLLVFLIGILGNVLVILVVLCVREMKTATNLCLMNLSVADLLVLVVCQPSAMLEFILEEVWLLGDFM